MQHLQCPVCIGADHAACLFPGQLALDTAQLHYVSSVSVQKMQDARVPASSLLNQCHQPCCSYHDTVLQWSTLLWT